jgi:glycosyltransferase involved in cell wall biosynthesis
MRVAMEATGLLVTRTGIGLFTYEAMRHLAARPDVDLSAFAVSFRGRDRLPEVVPAGVSVVTRPMAAQPLRKAWLRTDHPVIERWTGRIDVVHGPNFVVPPAAHAAEVVSVHDLTTLHFPELCTDDTRQYPALIRRAVERGAWVHTIPAFVDEIVGAFGADRDRVVAIRNGLTASLDPQDRDGAAIAGGPRYLLGLGTIEPRKDFPLLVAAFDRLADEDPELRLVIAGPEGWGTDALTAAIDRATHGARIVRAGWVDDATRAALLRDAAVFVFSSRYEGFGFPPLEAMAVGTPVVATAVGGVPDTVGDAAVLTPAGDADGLAGAIDRVLSEPDLAAELVRRGTANLQRFSWQQTADDLLALYSRAIAAR